MDINADGLIFIAFGALCWLWAPKLSRSSYYAWLGYPYEYALKMNRLASGLAIIFGIVLFSGLIGR